MVELLIIREKDEEGQILKMKTDDGKIVFEHSITKEDKLNWLSAVPINSLSLIFITLSFLCLSVKFSVMFFHACE